MLFSSDHSESWLYRYFHEFYAEIIKIKELTHAGNLTFLPADNRQQLVSLLKHQSVEAAQQGGEQGAKLYREAQYLMVALTDEIFLHLLEWEGQEAWRSDLLEVTLFNSRAAGQRVFENLETLLRERDAKTLELARLYLIALALGFQGKYRNTDDAGELMNYRYRLFSFITARDASKLDEYLSHKDKRIFPDSYKYTLEPSHKKRPWLMSMGWWKRLFFVLFGLEPPDEQRQWLPSMVWWNRFFVAVGLALIVFSVLLWNSLIDDLDEKTDQILCEHADNKFCK